jgi:PAS domain S-box-containing protein
MATTLRDSGIDIIGDVPWGTHFCHFYETKDDILDILVPYFKAGLENNEFCMWVTCDPLTVEEATAALEKQVPDIEARIRQGNMEIVPYDRWYKIDGVFDMERVFDGWIGKLDAALDKGMEGLRATGNTAWLEKEDWSDFTEYEETLERIIGGYRMMAICTYSLGKCSAAEVLDVVRNHEYALTKQAGDWQLIESSERKRVAEALRVSESRYKRLIETAAEGVLTVDAAGRTTFANERAFQMLGYGRDEMAGKSIFDLVAPDQQPVLKATFQQLASGSSARADFDIPKKDGSLMSAMVSAAPIMDAEGNFEGALGMITDITERRVAEEMLQRANLELNGYARTVSHDLRNPLSSIALANNLLMGAISEDSPEDLLEEARESAAAIERNVNRCFTLTKDLLALAQAGQMPKSIQEVSVSEVIGTITVERAGELQAGGIKIESTPGMGTVMADPTHVYQVFSNLISNAIQHSGAPEPVVIVARLGDEEGLHRWRVCDNGSGIAPEDLDDIFMPFFRKGASGSTGIGLAIVEKIVRLYGGNIRAYNDHGACFEFGMQDMLRG